MGIVASTVDVFVDCCCRNDDDVCSMWMMCDVFSAKGQRDDLNDDGDGHKQLTSSTSADDGRYQDKKGEVLKGGRGEGGKIE